MAGGIDGDSGLRRPIANPPFSPSELECATLGPKAAIGVMNKPNTVQGNVTLI